MQIQENKPSKWIRTPKELNNQNPFLKATSIRVLENNKILFECQTIQGRKQIAISKEDLFEMSHEASYEDMSYMNVLNEPSVLNNLVQRYKKDKIFTYIGPILIVINPYKYLSSELDSTRIVRIRKKILNNDLQNDQPHIFMVAGKAYLNMNMSQKKQAIVISGESGAGKTQLTKYCMRILTSLSLPESKIMEAHHRHSLQEMILSCNPLLQAFGNSKTVRNDNSSRFGKYIQIYFGHNNAIKGASIRSYLLQKSRVVSIATEERTFHAFYALIASKRYKTMAPEQYKILKKGKCFTAIGIDDVDNFNQINEAMQSVQFEQKEQDKIWFLLKAILELGNIEFDSKPQQTNEQNPCNIINRELLSSIAEILEMTTQNLQNKLLFQKKLILKQTILKAYKKEGCEAHRNTLCKAIYNSIFEFILERINLKLKPKQPLNQLKLINTLDIFGFQDFQDNSMEQLCINFTNEKLLKLYNEYIFRKEIQLLRQDGLQEQLKKIKPPTNDEIIESIQGNGKSIFSIINDTTKQPPYTDENIKNGIQFNYNQSKVIGLNIKRKMAFTIKHSQSIIEYNMEGFKMKNLDKVNDDIVQILNNIQILRSNNKQGLQNKTLLNKFQNQIDDLINELSESNVQFIRCIKPNQRKQPNQPDQKYILTQMRYLGVFQTIQIRKVSFPVRKNYLDFAKEYHILFPSIIEKEINPRKVSEQILRQLECQQNQFMLGNKRVYINQRIQTLLNHKIYDHFKIRNKLATKIQRAYRKFIFASKVRKSIKVLIKANKFLVQVELIFKLGKFNLRRQCFQRIKNFSFVKQQQKIGLERCNQNKKEEKIIQQSNKQFIISKLNNKIEQMRQLKMKQNHKQQIIKISNKLKFKIQKVFEETIQNYKHDEFKSNLFTEKEQNQYYERQKCSFNQRYQIMTSQNTRQSEKIVQNLEKTIREFQAKSMKFEEIIQQLSQKVKDYQTTIQIQNRQYEALKRENSELKKSIQILRLEQFQNSIKQNQNLTQKCLQIAQRQQELNRKQTILNERQKEFSLKEQKLKSNQNLIQLTRDKPNQSKENTKNIQKIVFSQYQKKFQTLNWELDAQKLLNKQFKIEKQHQQQLILNFKIQKQQNLKLIKNLNIQLQQKLQRQKQLQIQKDALQKENDNLQRIFTSFSESSNRNQQQKQYQLRELRAINTTQQNQIHSLKMQVDLLQRLNQSQKLIFNEKQKNINFLKKQQIEQKEKIIKTLQASIDEGRSEFLSNQHLKTIGKLRQMYINEIQNKNNIINRQSITFSTQNNDQNQGRRRNTFIINRTQNSHDI